MLKLHAAELAIFFVGPSKKARIHPFGPCFVGHSYYQHSAAGTWDFKHLCHFMNHKMWLDCDVLACWTLLAHFPFAKGTVLRLKAFS